MELEKFLKLCTGVLRKTCPQPNPEKLLAYNEAFGLLDSDGGDIIVATDPDSDRVGVALYHEGVRTLVT